MKYKLIPSALHNFGHSFHSSMNYVDGVFIVDIIRDLVSGSVRRISIEFPGGHISPPGAYPEALLKSVGYWSASLKNHLARHGIEDGAVKNIKLEFQRPLPRCTVRAEDNRGKHYLIAVKKML